MIVVDTNLIGYLFLASDMSDIAEKAFLADSQWAAPLLWRSELRNVLVPYIRKRILTFEAANHIISEAIRLMKGQEYLVDSGRVLSLAASSSCSAYDCEFVALAEELAVPLVTVDREILAQFPKIAVPLTRFVGN